MPPASDPASARIPVRPPGRGISASLSSMMNSIRPMLMFSGEHHGQAEEAVSFYIETFPDSRLTAIEKYGPGETDPEGTVKAASFVLNGRGFMAMDSAFPHAFNFTPSISFYVNVDDLSEFDELVAGLTEGGQALMPPDDYGIGRRFAWVADRFGVTWQVHCG